MSAIRAFFGKLPCPSGSQAALGAAAVSASVGGGAWYYQQNADGQADAVKLAQEAAKKNEAQRAAAVEEAVKKETDTKPQQAVEEAPKQ